MRRVRNLFQERGFDDTIDFDLEADLSLNIFQVMAKARHDWDFDALRKTTENFTFLTNDNKDLRETEQDLSEVIKNGDTLTIVRVEETKGPTYSFNGDEFRRYERQLQFSSDDQAQTDFIP